MLAAWLTLLFAAPEPLDVTLSVPMTLPIASYSPTRELGPVATVSLVAALAAGLRSSTDTVPVEIDGEALTSCRGSISCLLTSQALATTQAQEGQRDAKYLLWVVNLSTVDVSRAGLLLIDLAKARALSNLSGADADAQVLEQAVAARVDRTELRSEADAAAFVHRFLHDVARPALDRAGAWGTPSTLRIPTLPAQVELRIDGVHTATLSKAGGRIIGAPSGMHRLELRAKYFALTSTTIWLEPHQELEVDLAMEPVITPGGVLRQLTRYSGVLAVSLGATATLYGATTSLGPGVNNLCISNTCSRWTRIGGDFAGNGGVPAIPLGVALIAGGLTWLVGSFIEGEDWEAPWISLAAGAILDGSLVATMVSAEK